jgi:hypothetical protein
MKVFLLFLFGAVCYKCVVRTVQFLRDEVDESFIKV